MKWFKVTAAFLVEADSADDAWDELSDALEEVHIADNYYVVNAKKASKQDCPEED